MPLAALALALSLALTGAAPADRAVGSAHFEEQVLPVLEDHCFSCHGNGLKKGNVRLDGFASHDAMRSRRDLWMGAMKNVRSGLMPPAGEPRLSADERRALDDWVKQDVLGIDPANPDPGSVTLRRLNRVEYRNTVRDLMGVDFNTSEEFPADDTGYGFDTIGDVLSISPLLLEKYIQAAETVVGQAVPKVSRVAPIEVVPGSRFRGESKGHTGARMSFHEPARVTHSVRAGRAGRRLLAVDLQVVGPDGPSPARCRLVFEVDGKALLSEELSWHDSKSFRHEFTVDWTTGGHTLAFALEPLAPGDGKKGPVDVRVGSVTIEERTDRSTWPRPRDFDRFFLRDDPGTPEGRRTYAREVLQRFATKAFRRPVDGGTLDRLVALAAETFDQPGKTVEEGVGQAMIAVLASPRFLFRVEDVEPGAPTGTHPLIDEYSLAARLSYFLWSSMPDGELTGLAARGALRQDLPKQVKRMMADPRADMFVKNFVGQWLQARDVENTMVDARAILARDDGEDRELKREQDELRAFIAEREAQNRRAAEKQAQNKGKGAAPAPPNLRPARQSGRFRRVFAAPRVELTEQVKRAMRLESELVFGEVVREDRGVLELIDSDHTYLNEHLAKYYGIPGVSGSEMRRVKLPADSPRGGVLTQGTVLLVTSNPTRTSPVKRGLFVLDNILGTPAPPAPPSVPLLEEAEKAFAGREPTLRETLELHRREPLCNACHARMDPIGLGLENFNAMGLYRESERKQPLDTAGTLLTGETFTTVRDLKRILVKGHRDDFYRCLTEKVMTYALGRGLEPTDVEAVDRVVARLIETNGRFSALLTGVIESAPFQKRRNVPEVANAARPVDATPETTGAKP